VLTAALLELRNYPGRKTVLLLADRILDPCPEYRSLYYERLRRLSDLAARSSATIYGLHTLAFSSGAMMPERRATSADVRGPIGPVRLNNMVSDSLRRLAEPTGGFALRSNSVRDLLGAALTDQEGYYTLASARHFLKEEIEVPNPHRSGQPKERQSEDARWFLQRC
jgi:hypothetical protein